MPVLWLCQEKWGWISPGIMRAAAARLDLAPAFVEGVVTFYTMYQRRPPGKYLLQVCTTLSCQLCGTTELVQHLKTASASTFGETTEDGCFTLVDVQCLGACGEAPVLQINNDYFTESRIARARRSSRRIGGPMNGTNPSPGPRGEELEDAPAPISVGRGTRASKKR